MNQPTPQQADNPPDSQVESTVNYEKSDAHLRPAAGFVAGVALIVVLAGVLVGEGFRWLSARHQRGEAATYPTPNSKPARELQELRQREDQTLTEYRWVSKEKGIVQIPIDRAIELTVEELNSQP